MSKKPKIVAIVGPTASGKTSLSIKLAQQYNGEVISADSRQVYEGMDIGTGKVTPSEMKDIPHHLLDIAEPMEIYTGAQFKQDATVAIEQILQRGKLPIVAGGTFFYLELLRGNMQAAPVEPNLPFRKSLEPLSNQELLERLQQTDPKRAERIDPDNRRRLERALEIIETLGTVPEPTTVESDYQWLLLGVKLPKEELHHNIKIRLQQRIDEGMIREVEDLLKSGISKKRLDDLGLEYRYIQKYLDQELTLTEIIEQLEAKIRQFAKRQLTWLKRYPEIVWIDPRDTASIEKQVTAFLNS